MPTLNLRTGMLGERDWSQTVYGKKFASPMSAMPLFEISEEDTKILDTKLISLKDRRSMHLSIFTFKCINNLAPIPFNEYFTLYQPKRSIRNSEMKLLVPRSKLEFAERSVLVRGSKTFNNLPEHVRLESSLPSFKAKLLDLFTA